MENKPAKVTLLLYDLSNGMARQFSPMMVGKLVEAIYHSSIVVYGVEYFFGGGICTGLPKQTPYGFPIKEIDFGETEIPKEMFEEYLREINNKFTIDTYNFLNNNCNHFTHEIGEFLTGNPLPDYVLKQHELLNDSPFGQMILQMLGNSQNQSFVPQAFEGRK